MSTKLGLCLLLLASSFFLVACDELEESAHTSLEEEFILGVLAEIENELNESNDSLDMSLKADYTIEDSLVKSWIDPETGLQVTEISCPGS